MVSLYLAESAEISTMLPRRCNAIRQHFIVTCSVENRSIPLPGSCVLAGVNY